MKKRQKNPLQKAGFTVGDAKEFLHLSSKEEALVNLLNTVRGPILRTWNAIAADGYELCEGDNECAIELCIDANRMAFHSRGKELEEAKAAEKALAEVMKDFDYPKIRKFLNKHIQLL